MKRYSLRGFTLIELLVTLSIIALLLSIAAPRYFASVARSEEAVLKKNLTLMRDAVDKYYSDMGRYPASLDDLVVNKYMRNVPTDPVTRTASSWTVVAPPDIKQGAVFDVKSGAKGVGLNGKPYEQW